MPHPKNRLKLTGDTHLPDVGYDSGFDDDQEQTVVLEDVTIVYADGWVPSLEQPADQPQEQGAVQKIERQVQQLPARKPWLAIGMALTAGWLLARMLRRH